jgi:trehalose 6-phosphate phosphatase
MTVLPLPLTPPIAERLSGSPFVALLDVDGTLAPIARRPEQAAVPDATRRIVAELAALPDSVVAIVSGRAAADAARLVGVPGVWTIGNHGLEMGTPNEAPRPRPELARFADAMAHALDQSRAFAAEHSGVIVEDKRWTLSVHYRLVDPPAIAEVVHATRAIAERLGLRATSGRRVIEIRPPIDVDKGTASIDLLRELRATTAVASVFCAGDDRTDEDMFRRVRVAGPRAVTVRVLGDPDLLDPRADYESSAELSVRDPEALRDMLSAILDLRRAL